MNVVLVLAITRLPVYIRTTRAEVLELRERMFVSAARVMGASPLRIALRHVLPMVVPTLMTIATVEFAYVMLAESGLSFLGIGIQPPEVTWGLMVAQGRNYLGTAWWLAFFPGLAIMLTTLAVNLLASWLRIAMDPLQRWRLEGTCMTGHLLEIRDLSVEFRGAAGTVHAVRELSLHVDRGETLAIMGESGSGKSVSASAVMDILDSPPGFVTSGEVLFEGRDLLRLPMAERRRINGEQDRHDLPGPAGPPEPGLHCRLADRGDLARAPGRRRQGGARDGDPAAGAGSASPSPSGASTTTRTSSRAGSGSG